MSRFSVGGGAEVSIANMQITPDKIIFGADDFLSGLYTQYTTDITGGPAPVSPNLSYADAFNPFRFLGYASPGLDTADVTNVTQVTDTIRNIAFGSESSVNYGYLVQQNSRLNRLVLSTKTLSNAGVWPHTIAGAGAITGNDIVSYSENIAGTRTRCEFYSWNDSGGAWNIGLYNTAAGTFDDDWFTTIPATPITPAGNNKPHRLVVGVDDLLYIADGNKVHALDGATGANGTVSNTVFLLPAGFIIQDMVAWSYQTTDFLVILAYFSPTGDTVNPDTVAPNQNARAYFWDYLNSDPTMVSDLNDAIVTCGIVYDGTLAVFTNGIDPVNGDEDFNSKLKMYDGTRFKTIINFIGNAPMPGGIEVIGDSLQWNTGGNIHAYGSPFAGIDSGHNILVNAAGTSEGLLRTTPGISGYQMISSGTSTTGGLETMTAGTYESTAAFTSGGAFPTFPEGQTGKIKSVKVEFAQNATGGRDFSLYLVKEGETAIQILSGVQIVDSSNIVKKYEFTSADGIISNQFRELRLTGQWGAGTLSNAAPVLKQVTVEYESENLEATGV